MQSAPQRLAEGGSRNDRIDARKLAELLRTNLLSPVYHGEKGLRTLKELARVYLTISKDLTRVMNRVKAIYRSWGIPCGGQSVYNPRHRKEWLARSPKPACAAGPSFTTSSSTRSFSCANKRGKNSSPRARSTKPGNCFVPFRPWVRSARPC
ncbi:MAG: hypothetical protein DMG54_07310 [Acidobacteria bacterium]|nr:MAG: hypothetical protein DMG54_07310 [Acidobacteriota bacterium]PYU69697.1 MAG: hypothetical protein DMG52_28220 [Acidobacteriota bacterium]